MNKCNWALFIAAAVSASNSWKIISREEWEARPPMNRIFIEDPVSYVVVHHSYNPEVCLTMDACEASMRSMQNFHIDVCGWGDFGYNFAVGGDGNVYVGRGFGVVEPHAPNYNPRSMRLLLIGNFTEELPPKTMMKVAQEFIAYAVKHGFVMANYTLYGLGQVRDTESPKDAFYVELKQWPHWKPNWMTL